MVPLLHLLRTAQTERIKSARLGFKPRVSQTESACQRQTYKRTKTSVTAKLTRVQTTATPTTRGLRTTRATVHAHAGHPITSLALVMATPVATPIPIGATTGTSVVVAMKIQMSLTLVQAFPSSTCSKKTHKAKRPSQIVAKLTLTRCATVRTKRKKVKFTSTFKHSAMTRRVLKVSQTLVLVVQHSM
jgi:hypothetical protein